MLAGKIFFEAIKYQSQNNNFTKTGSNFKLNLVLNDIYYDELKQFHMKYLCLTTSDQLTLELYDQTNQSLIGVTNVYDVYKLIQQQRSIEIKINHSQTYGDLTLLLSFQPVSAVHKRKSISPAKRKLQQTTKSPLLTQRIEETETQKQNFIYVQDQNSFSNESKYQTEKEQSSNFDSANMLQRKQSQSIQSLAQQRQKILGQLFGKFKRQR